MKRISGAGGVTTGPGSRDLTREGSRAGEPRRAVNDGQMFRTPSFAFEEPVAEALGNGLADAVRLRNDLGIQAGATSTTSGRVWK